MEEQFQQKRLNYNTRQRQQRSSETEEERKERLKKKNEKDHTTSAKEKVVRIRWRGPRFGCSEANQKELLTKHSVLPFGPCF